MAEIKKEIGIKKICVELSLIGTSIMMILTSGILYQQSGNKLSLGLFLIGAIINLTIWFTSN